MNTNQQNLLAVAEAHGFPLTEKQALEIAEEILCASEIDISKADSPILSDNRFGYEVFTYFDLSDLACDLFEDGQ